MDNVTLKAIPTLRILDYWQALDFYLDMLGFKMDWEHRFGEDEPVYMQISKNCMKLHLTEHERFQTGAIIYVETHGLKSFHKELLKRNPEQTPKEIMKTDWGTWQVEVEDPFGNLLRFNQNR
ncbi:MAG: VOC family protein [Bacteroidetes bacterium]|jgi:uncharacterized glyoxalase superfamily protein PhnB|nr:VOC family protein [Bacteroidota bacterium]